MHASIFLPGSLTHRYVPNNTVLDFDYCEVLHSTHLPYDSEQVTILLWYITYIFFAC